MNRGPNECCVLPADMAPSPEERNTKDPFRQGLQRFISAGPHSAAFVRLLAVLNMVTRHYAIDWSNTDQCPQKETCKRYAISLHDLENRSNGCVTTKHVKSKWTMQHSINNKNSKFPERQLKPTLIFRFESAAAMPL